MSESLIGRTLGDFRILRLIGAGGMGAVYAAEQVSLGRRVALKVLSPHVGAPGSHGDRFRREAEAAARLNHPSIVSIYAQGNQDNLWYYAMELIEGESLDRLVARLRSSASPQPTESVDPFAVTEKLSATELGSQAAAPAIPPTTAAALTLHRRPRRDWIECAVRYAVEAARALAFAHSCGVLHRDIKPANLILSAAGHLKITDFGLAAVLDAPGLTISGEIMGTPSYMSPEQARGAGQPIDHRADIYSLGATLFELVTLQAPFTGATPFEILQRIASEDAPGARRVNPSIPKDLETIIAKMMERDPARRYASAAEAADDLERFLRGEPILARPIGWTGRVVRFVRRRKAVSALAAASVLVLALSVVLVASRRQWGQAQRDLAAREKESAAADLVAQADQALTMGRKDDALQALDDALELNANQAGALNLRARLMFSDEDYADAIRDLDKLIALQPDNAAALYLRSVAHRMRSESAKAEADEGRAHAINPNTPDAYYALAIAQRTAGALDDAIANLGKALRMDPGHFDARVARGQLLMRQGRLGEARADFLRAAAIAPGNPAPYGPLADISWRQGKRQEALQLLTDARRSVGEDPDLLAAQGDLLRRAGRYDESIEALQIAVAKAPRKTDLFVSLAESQYLAGDYGGALEALQTPIRMFPGQQALSDRLMLILNQMGRSPKQARDEALERVLALSRQGAPGRALPAEPAPGQPPGARKGPRGPFPAPPAGGAGAAGPKGPRRGPALDFGGENPAMLATIYMNFGEWDKALEYADEATSRALNIATAGRPAFGLRRNSLLARSKALRLLGRFEDADKTVRELESIPDLASYARAERALLEQARALSASEEPGAPRAPGGGGEEWLAAPRQLIEWLYLSGQPGANPFRSNGASLVGLIGRLRSLWPGLARGSSPKDDAANAGRKQIAARLADTARQRVAANDEDVEAWIRLAVGEWMLNDSGAAERALERAIQLEPLLDLPYLVRARLRLQAKDEDGALADLRCAHELAPDETIGLDDLLTLLYKTGHVDEAQRVYDEAAFDHADSQKVHWILGEQCADELIRPEQAEFHFRQITVGLNPKTQAVQRFYEILFNAAELMGDWTLASAAAKQSTPDSPYLAALVAEAAGDYGRARAAYAAPPSSDAEWRVRGLRRLNEAAERGGGAMESPPADSAPSAAPSTEPAAPARPKAAFVDGHPVRWNALEAGRHALELRGKSQTSWKADLWVPDAGVSNAPFPVAVLLVDPGDGASSSAETIAGALVQFGFAVVRIDASSTTTGADGEASPWRDTARLAGQLRDGIATPASAPSSADATPLPVSVVGLGHGGVMAACAMAAEVTLPTSFAFLLSDADAESLLSERSKDETFAAQLRAGLAPAPWRRVLLLGVGESPRSLEACLQAAHDARRSMARVAFDDFDDDARLDREGLLLGLWLSSQGPFGEKKKTE